MFDIFSQSYPTFVVFLAVVLSIVVTMALMPALIRALRIIAISANRFAPMAPKAIS